VPGELKGPHPLAFRRVHLACRRVADAHLANLNLLLRAITDLFAAIAAIFRRQDELLLVCVIVALRPAVIGAFFKNHHFLRGLLKALPGGVQLGPIFMQLIAARRRQPDCGGRQQATLYAR
jgi:hypothetical protein